MSAASPGSRARADEEKPPGALACPAQWLWLQRTAVTTESRLAELETAIAYIATQNELAHMKCSEAKRRNYPIGTGITEAAAKTLAGIRMKRAGARFLQHGATIMLFRAALLSDRFEALHNELGATYRKDVRTAA